MAVSRDCRDGVAVTHPYLRIFLKALEQRVLRVERSKMRAAVFTRVGLFNLSAIRGGDKLRTVAYSEHGKLADKPAQVGLESLRIVDGIRRTAEDYAYDALGVLRKLVVGQDFAERVKLTHTTADKLRSL